MAGFVILVALLLFIIIYPVANPGNPLEMIGLNSFTKPGTYVNLHDSLQTRNTLIFRLPGAAERRIENKLSNEDRVNMQRYLLLAGLSEDEVDIQDTESLLSLWWNHYDPDARLGATIADRRYFARLDERVKGLFDSEDLVVYAQNPDTGEYEELRKLTDTEYVLVSDVPNIVTLPLGTDNFGRDMLRELVAAIETSLLIGLIAGSIATVIGLLLGLSSGFIGSIFDDIIMFVINIFNVIPPFVLLILISFSISQDLRGAATVAIVIGFTSWTWTARGVRAQVLSLRARDHVSISRLSGHSIVMIILKDILPYIASYVVMAFILQVAAAILAEAGLSILGLGPKTTEVPTLGLMMNWAMSYSAHMSGAWWAYYPVVLIIALIAFSLNLMNTGLDKVFNPQLRD